MSQTMYIHLVYTYVGHPIYVKFSHIELATIISLCGRQHMCHMCGLLNCTVIQYYLLYILQDEDNHRIKVSDLAQKRIQSQRIFMFEFFVCKLSFVRFIKIYLRRRNKIQQIYHQQNYREIETQMKILFQEGIIEFHRENIILLIVQSSVVGRQFSTSWLPATY